MIKLINLEQGDINCGTIVPLKKLPVLPEAFLILIQYRLVSKISSGGWERFTAEDQGWHPNQPWLKRCVF